jgi:hypothetical protein
MSATQKWSALVAHGLNGARGHLVTLELASAATKSDRKLQ